MKIIARILLLLSLFIPVAVCSQLRLPAILSSGMVLQQHDSAVLWGWAGPGEKVFVTTGWDNRTDSTTATSGATWRMRVKTPAAGGPYTITLRSRNTIRLDDVMVGEVWVCSGQSNMEWSYNNGAKDIRPELAQCYTPNIRFYHIPKTTAAAAQDDTKAQWTVCDSNTLKSFTAVGYFFGKKLQEQLHVPIGLINASWGGTPAETWTPASLVEADAGLKAAAGQLQPSKWWPVQPGLAWNAMIAPITPFNIAGAIWYQGESNTGTNSSYRQLFTTMIDAWRKEWSKAFPFYYVQIAPFKYGNEYVGALLREAQTKALSHPNTGMVVITDLVDSVTNIHPSQKHEVGYRLAAWALAETYHRTGIHYKSPQFKAAEKKGDKLVLSFDNVPTTLVARDKAVTGFYVSGAQEAWYPADASIEKDRVIIKSKSVKDPVYVRYGFSNTLIGNVFSAEGLPLCPFRSDEWQVEQKKL